MPRLVDRAGNPATGQMPGFVEAIVVDNVDPDELGRVKVKFPSLPETPEAHWARLGSIMAGRNRGWVSLPEKEDEVLVTFVHGDINNAIVLGALYNGVDTPPYANEDGKNNLRVFQSRSGHRVTFDDEEGAERIELILHNEEIRVIWDAKEKVLSLYCGKDIKGEAVESISMKCKDFILKADNSISVSTTSTFEHKTTNSTSVDGGGKLLVFSPDTQILSA
jgi:phage baseplate assembly protein gpV